MVKYSINVNLHLHLLVFFYVTNAELSVQPAQKVWEKLKGIFVITLVKFKQSPGLRAGFIVLLNLQKFNQNIDFNKKYAKYFRTYKHLDKIFKRQPESHHDVHRHHTTHWVHIYAQSLRKLKNFYISLKLKYLICQFRSIVLEKKQNCGLSDNDSKESPS